MLKLSIKSLALLLLSTLALAACQPAPPVATPRATVLWVTGAAATPQPGVTTPVPPAPATPAPATPVFATAPAQITIPAIVLPQPSPSVTPLVWNLPSAQPTRCLAAGGWQIGGGETETITLAEIPARVPFPVAAPDTLKLAYRVILVDAYYTEARDGSSDLVLEYAGPNPPDQVWDKLTMIYAQSPESIEEYLAAHLVNACALQEVSVRGQTGYTFWVGESTRAGLIWQEGDVKVSLWLELHEPQPSAEQPHVLDEELLAIAKELQPLQ